MKWFLSLMAESYLSEADALYDQGGIENYKRSIDLYLKALEANPNDYEANWKCARTYMDYGEEAKKQKAQSSFERAYESDKMYDDAGPILALGRFWAIIPWPFKDKQKALRYYREYQATEYFAENDKGKIYLAELLLKLDRKENKAEAKALLEKVAQSDDKYFSDRANSLLAKIN
jgi:tetratricopeptide (TPR) repeat protein